MMAMPKYLLLIVLMFALHASSCCAYRELRIIRKYSMPGVDMRGGHTGEAAEAGKIRNFIRAGTARYLALICSSTPAAAINNRGVILAVEGNHGAAGNLFREAAAEDGSSGAARNNLAVIHELMGRGDEAFRMYAAACLLEPGNRRFRYNFDSFADYREARRRGGSADIPPENIEKTPR